MTSKILPNTKTVEAAGEQIIIREFGFGQLPAVAKHLATIFANVNGADINIPDLVVSGGEDLLAVLSIATKKPRDWFDDLDNGEGIELLTAVIDVNKESFEKKLKPALAKLMQGLQKPVSKAKR